LKINRQSAREVVAASCAQRQFVCLLQCYNVGRRKMHAVREDARGLLQMMLDERGSARETLKPKATADAARD
jgi:hypothetical protein